MLNLTQKPLKQEFCKIFKQELNKKNMEIVTGGAGFIGSHLVERLVKENKEVLVLDNFSTGKIENLKNVKDRKNLRIERCDLATDRIDEKLKDAEVVYHLAANPEVRLLEPNVHFSNVVATFNLLEAMRKNDVNKIVFTSSSTVYGDSEIIPTPEEAILKPISLYGAAKLAAEALISSYAHSYGFDAYVFRLANVVGKRSNHGVIFDFIRKLKANPKVLEILGDGTQRKSYIHVSDCISAIMFVKEKKNKGFNVFNVGNTDSISVLEIADVVIDKLNLKNVEKKILGGREGRGWVGDVKFMHLDISKLLSLGWKPSLNSRQAVERATIELIEDFKE
jgi:UDP-glucose 4-epimerase